jgi:hypothetical protein
VLGTQLELVARHVRHPRGDRARVRAIGRKEQVRGELVGRRKSAPRVVARRAKDDLVEGVRKTGDQLTRRRHRLGEDAEREARGLGLVQPALAGERLPQDDTDGVEVRLPRHRGAGELLARHVPQLALHLAGGGHVGAAERLGDPEVEEARHTVGADLHVVRRYVAVDDPERRAERILRLVRRVQALERVDHDPDRDAERHAPPALRVRARAKEPRQADPVHVLHDDVQDAIHDHRVKRLYDVWVMDARAEPGLVEQAVLVSVALGEERLELLYRHESREAPRPHAAPEVNARHTAARELVEHDVLP